MHYQTARLAVHPLTDADESAIIELFADPVVKKTYMVPDFSSREDAVKLFLRLKSLSQTENRYVAGIYLGDILIGILNETEITGGTIELGYAILSRYHNKGYGTEMLSGAISYLFDKGFNEILTGAFSDNPASIRIMIKCGMQKLDRQEQIEYRGKSHLCLYYSIHR